MFRQLLSCYKAVFRKEDTNDFSRFYEYAVYNVLSYHVLQLVLSYCHFKERLFSY